MTSTQKRWFITGASSGFGREIVRAAASRGDYVVATARRPEVLDDLLAEFPDCVSAVELDVTDPVSVGHAVEGAVGRRGGIDVVVNNAGYGTLGALEELSDDQIQRQFDTNVFGAISVTRAVLPIMREQRAGHVIQLSSISGAQPWIGFSAYVASKHALEGLSSSLAGEVEPLGIRVTIIEPGPFRTDFFTRSMDRTEAWPEYAESVGQTRAFLEGFTKQPGDPARAAAAIIEVTDAGRPPLRLALGSYAVDEFRAEYKRRLAELDDWEDLSRGADFPAVAGTA